MEMRIAEGQQGLEPLMTVASCNFSSLNLRLKVSQRLDSMLTLGSLAAGGKVFEVKVFEGLGFQNDLASLHTFAILRTPEADF